MNQLTLEQIMGMNVKIADGEALRRLTPEMLMAYLTKYGFKEESAYPDRIAGIWVSGSKELLVPYQADLGDYARRTYEIVDYMALAHSEYQLKTYQDILESVPVPAETLDISELVAPQPTIPAMPIHDSIRKEDDVFIQRATDFVDWLSENGYTLDDENGEHVHLYESNAASKLVFKYLELDHKEWMEEKYRLGKWVMDEAQRKAQQ